MDKWLEFLLAQLLTCTRAEWQGGAAAQQLRLVDGTTIRRKGRPTWRVHARYNPLSGCFDDLVLTLDKVAEGVGRTAIAAGELLVSDRGYARVRDFAKTLAAGADFICRIGWRSLRLRTEDGAPFRPLAVLPAEGQTVEHPVRLHGIARTLRCIVAPIPEEKAAKQRARASKHAKRNGHQVTAETVLAAGYLMLLTSLPACIPAAAVVELYRCRWQIELAFKRLKSLGHIDKLPAVGNTIAKVWLLGHLIAAVITEQIASQLRRAPALPARSNPREPSPWRLWQRARRILLAAIEPRTPRPSRRRIATLRDRLTEGKRRRKTQASRLRAA